MTDGESPPAGRPPGVAGVNPVLDRLAAYSWRLLVVAAAGLAVLWLVGRLRLVMLPLVVALFLSRILAVPTGWLRRRGLPPAAAAALAVVAFLASATLVMAVIGASVTRQAEDFGPTIGQAVDDVERWLVDDSPFDLDPGDIEQARQQLGTAVGNALRSSSGAVVSGAILVAEALVGIILGLIVTFFVLKDGDRFVAWARRLLPEPRRPVASAMARRAWETLGGYLRGAALLGAVEGSVMGLTLAVVGAELAVPVAVLTFLAAFVPFVGAIVAGVVAVLVALGTGGPTDALVVAVVALVLQQLDNDLLAPVVYGRALNLHPVVILLGITAGGALFGLAGSFLAVPFTAVVVNAATAARAHGGPGPGPGNRSGNAERR